MVRLMYFCGADWGADSLRSYAQKFTGKAIYTHVCFCISLVMFHSGPMDGRYNYQTCWVQEVRRCRRFFTMRG